MIFYEIIGDIKYKKVFDYFCMIQRIIFPVLIIGHFIKIRDVYNG